MKKYFFTGLVTLLPLAVTLWVVHFAIDFLTKPFIGVVTLLTKHLPIGSFGIFNSQQIIGFLSQIFILVGLFLLVFTLGFVARRYFFWKMLQIGDDLLIKIPFVNKVYKTSKDIVKSLLGNKAGSFKQVVMIPFPYPGCYCIGLIARDAPRGACQSPDDDLVSVFVPTTPNPTTGFLVMSKKSELIFLEMKSEEAVKYIVSCGVIVPGEREEL